MKTSRREITSVLVLMLFLFTGSFRLFAQDDLVTGTVTDATGEPLIGVNVIVKENPATGTITDMDGNYSLRPNGGTTLEFSYIGYAPQRVPIGGRKVVNVQLKEDSESLDEVVVVGYGTQKKAR